MRSPLERFERLSVTTGAHGVNGVRSPGDALQAGLTAAPRATIIPPAVPAMPRKQPAPGPSIGFPGLLCVALLCLFAAACGDSCISGVFNPPNSMFQVKTCSLTSTNGTMSVSGHGSAPAAQTGSFSLRHVFVAISGIEVSSDASLEWREIAPALEREPVQLDLLSSASAANRCAQSPLAVAQIPPGDYTHIRLRLASDAGEVTFASGLNQCRDIGVNCAVASDGAIRALAIDPGALEIRVAPSQASGGFVRVMPDTQTDVQIVFDGSSSRAAFVGDSLNLIPAFIAESPSPCNPFAQARPKN
jgi:hypothetical protein